MCGAPRFLFDDANLTASFKPRQLHLAWIRNAAVQVQGADQVFFGEVALLHRVPEHFAIADEHALVTFEQRAEAVGIEGHDSKKSV